MSEDKIKRLAIVCGYPFPEGLAPTTRILAYAKGLVEAGIQTDIFIYFPTESKNSGFPVDGNIHGIRYHYPHTRLYPQSKILRMISHVYYCIVSILLLLKENKRQKFDIVILSTDWFRILYSFVPIIRLIGARPIFIADEYPTPIRVYLKQNIPKWKRILFRNILRQVKGMVFMTEKLSLFFNNIIVKPSCIMPSVTDVSRFINIDKDNFVSKYICYMGNLELSKDNVDNIIYAFKIISDRYPDLEFHIYGEPSANDLNKIIETIEKCMLNNRVILKGRVSNDKVPEILVNSYILVSSQPNTKRAEGGFPTKLGEYMSCGVPVLMTNVGEISQYVSDGVNGWLATPDNPSDYAEKLEYIINNYEEALAAAARAKTFILENFDYRIPCAKLISFLNNLM